MTISIVKQGNYYLVGFDTLGRFYALAIYARLDRAINHAHDLGQL